MRTLPGFGIEGLHPEVIDAANDLFADGHYPQAILEAVKALEGRVRSQSGIDRSGRELMEAAFRGDSPLINVAVEQGRSGRNEQEGFRFILWGSPRASATPKVTS